MLDHIDKLATHCDIAIFPQEHEAFAIGCSGLLGRGCYQQNRKRLVYPHAENQNSCFIQIALVSATCKGWIHLADTLCTHSESQ